LWQVEFSLEMFKFMVCPFSSSGESTQTVIARPEGTYI
jgi:hypothetical protein